MSKVLVVDDESDIRFMHRRILAKAGHEVTEAGDGAMALAAVRDWAPDLVITDMMMPIMDGAELIRRLREDPATAAIPVLSVSGDSQLAGEADIVLTKPCLTATLLAAAQDLLQRGRGAR
ncbi:response regulator [Actinoplanes awajinensis]|uniref:Response regulator receiver protein n=1 Tax=Actinoplanes awajinensis subsp. mycoplanecinus TaxID=135947 RepID=A0A101JKS2_9ACTN|nr:response regulator [Actinoplanes awajinensis]KUL28549.1 response regulator receiver protein [Actinoplanes awajinensis subsp. mycoplanecinus]